MNEIFTRTSVRNFTEKMPSDDQIELVLKAAMQAPSAGNQRSWEFYVVRDRTTLTLLSSVGTYGGCTKFWICLGSWKPFALCLWAFHLASQRRIRALSPLKFTS